MMVTVYHNPDCGSSRAVLALLAGRGLAPEVIEYLKTPPRRAELVDLVERMGVPARAVMRRGALYNLLGLDEATLTDDALIDAMIAHPILMNRPIVATPLGVKLCRLPELVLQLLAG